MPYARHFAENFLYWILAPRPGAAAGWKCAHAIDPEWLKFIISFISLSSWQPPMSHTAATREKISLKKNSETERNSKVKIKTDIYKALHPGCVIDFSLLKNSQGPEETFVLILIWLCLSLLPRLISFLSFIDDLLEKAESLFSYQSVSKWALGLRSQTAVLLAAVRRGRNFPLSF